MRPSLQASRTSPKKVTLAAQVSEESFLFLGAGNKDSVGQKTSQLQNVAQCTVRALKTFELARTTMRCLYKSPITSVSLVVKPIILEGRAWRCNNHSAQ